MSERKSTTLERIENNRKLTSDTDFEFFYALQQGLLLALKELERLDEMQYRAAQQHLNKQRAANASFRERGQTKSSM